MNTDRLLIFRASAQSQGIAALSTRQVIETMRPLRLESMTPSSSSAGFIIGASIVRGQPTPVIDLARLLGEISDRRPSSASQEHHPTTRWITVHTSPSESRTATTTRIIAIQVHEVLGIRRQSEIKRSLDKLPPLLSRNSHQSAIEELAVLDGELLLLLESAKIITNEEVDRFLKEQLS